MPTLINPYEELWEKHLSLDDMNAILETRMGGTDYGKLSILSATNNDKSVSTNANTTISGQTGTAAK